MAHLEVPRADIRPICCVAPAHDESPHFAGTAHQMSTLLVAASHADAHLTDVRGREAGAQLVALDAFHAEARVRARGRTGRGVRAVALDATLLEDASAMRMIRDIVETRRLGLHLWLEHQQELPRRLAVQLMREHCSRCVVERIGDGLRAGITL